MKEISQKLIIDNALSNNVISNNIAFNTTILILLMYVN